MYAPGLVVAGIGLEELAAAEVISLDICSYAYIVRVGIGLKGFPPDDYGQAFGYRRETTS